MNLTDAIAAAAGWSPLRWALTVLAVLFAVFVAWALVEARTIKVSRAVLTSPNLPAAFDGATVVFAADIHAGPYLGRSRMRALVDQINALEPDVVILGGDYVGGRSGGAKAFYSEVGGIDGAARRLRGTRQPRLLGGREQRLQGHGRCRRQAARERERDLVARWSRASESPVSTTRGSVTRTSMRLPPASATMSSRCSSRTRPTTSPTRSRARAARSTCALAGHTHGGQLTVFGMLAPLVPSVYGQRYKGGWLEESGVPVLVTRGAGNVTVPLRFFAQPEIHVIELRRGPKSVEGLEAQAELLARLGLLQPRAPRRRVTRAPARRSACRPAAVPPRRRGSRPSRARCGARSRTCSC